VVADPAPLMKLWNWIMASGVGSSSGDFFQFRSVQFFFRIESFALVGSEIICCHFSVVIHSLF
jgi:hypothetical protein